MFFNPLPYWLCLLIGRGGPHLYLPGACCFLIVIANMAVRVTETNFGRPVPVISLASKGTLLAAYIASNTVLGLYGYVLMRSYGVLRSPTYSPAIMRSNQAFLKDVQTIPQDASVCYWTRRNVAGFLSNRSDVWLFPYAFDKTDFLVIQKNVDDSFFEFRQAYADLNLKELSEGNENTKTFFANKVCSSGTPCRIVSADIDFVRNLLTRERMDYIVFFEDRDTVILKSKMHRPIYKPLFTETLYWR